MLRIKASNKMPLSDTYLEIFSLFRFYVKIHFTIVGATIKDRDRGLILSIHTQDTWQVIKCPAKEKCG